MTREERLDWLCRLRSNIYVYMPYEWIKPMDEALTEAIKALEQMNVLDKIRAEIVADKEKWWYGVNDDCFMKLSDILAIIDKYRRALRDD